MSLPKWPSGGERELALLREVIEGEHWGGHHPMVARFEQEFAAFVGCAFGVAACNGTVTLEMALSALGVGAGDEVIVPAISFISTATAVSRVGATPVFVDVEGDTFQMDPARAQAAISGRTRAVVVVHFGGPMADMERLASFASSAGVALIEDAAHAHGSEWNGRRAGSIGVAGSFSFQNSKVMTAGEGGLLASNDEALLAHARSIGDLGRMQGGGWFFHYEIGTNFRMSALQAAVLLAQFEKLPEQNCRRARNARTLRAGTAGVRGLRWQHVPDAAGVHTNYLSLGRIDAAAMGRTRDMFQQALTGLGVPCTAFYPHTLYNNPVYRRGGCRVEPCPVAEACILDAFWLPHRVLLGSEDDTRALAAAVRQAAGQ
jgi:dTDP-4-amino-4,6-dideoxygalactose transaminase